MDVYFNERSLSECKNVDKAISHLDENLNFLSKEKFNIYTSLNDVIAWKDKNLDLTAKNYFVNILKLLENIPDNNSQSYYYHFTHEEFGLSIGENISTSSLSIAADKILLNQLTAVISIPESGYNNRPYLPILKSSYDSKLKDELAHVRCFCNAKELKCFIFLEKKIKPIVCKTEYDAFSQEYLSHIREFDSNNWKPKQYNGTGELLKTYAFPISNCPTINKYLSKWHVKKESTEFNIAQFKELGGIIMFLNGYYYNSQLSAEYKYMIYEGGYGNNKLLISLDIENGGLEVIDGDGTHIGVYKYNGTLIEKIKETKKLKSHSLKNIPKHMFIFKE